MKKELVELLKNRITEVAKTFSKDREKNFDNETFEVDRVEVLSEYSAAVIFRKYPSLKKAVALFLWINSWEGYWLYFFPTDSHLLGLNYISSIKKEIENFNFYLN